MSETISQEIDVANNKETAEQRIVRLKAIGFQPGVSGNPSGRPKGTMKDYLRRKFMEMSDEDKEVFLAKQKVDGKSQIEFGEGKAKQDMDINAEVTTKVIDING